MAPSENSKAAFAAWLVSALGHVLHNLTEFSPAILLGPETLVPLGVTAFLAVGWYVRPGQVTALATAGWALLVIVVGGGSVFPFGFLPFVPEQSLSHYAAHFIYAVMQIPLLWVSVRRL